MKSAKCGCLYTEAVQMCPLHAAAPTMLAVLARLVGWDMKGTHGLLSMQNGDDGVAPINDAILTARATIAKAKGAK